jgi:hypothetical protein
VAAKIASTPKIVSVTALLTKKLRIIAPMSSGQNRRRTIL